MSNQTLPAPRIDAPGRSGPRSVVLIWVITRLLMLVLLVVAERVALGDPSYYWRKIDALFDVGLAQTLNEYPTPVVWMLTVPYALGAGTRYGYRYAFIAVMMVLDGLFTAFLWRVNGRRRDSAVNFWLGFVFLIGPLTYLRFDLVPAVLAGSAVLFARRRPGLSGILIGVGAAIKLWPALLIGALGAERRTRRASLIGFAISGFGLALVSLIFGGLHRLVSPLTWQSDRGLQIESLWSTPLMIGRVLRPRVWRVDISTYQAFEIFGPGVQAFLVASNVATVVGLLVIMALIIRAFRNGSASPIAIALMVLAIIAVMTVTNKTLSPQYLLWLGGPMAALLLINRRSHFRRPDLVRRLAIQVLVLALLTHLIYPLLYTGLEGLASQSLMIIATVVLVLRNLGLLIFTVSVCASAWRALRTPVTPRS